MKTVYIIMIVILVLSSQAAAEQQLTFSTADDQSHSRSRAMNAVLTECFQRMGMKLNIIPMPSERSLQNADKGTEDGNFVRTGGITVYPNLIQVPEKIAVNPIVAFSKNTGIRIEGWKSLSKYHIVYVNGWKNCDREIINPKSKTTVKNEILLFTLLEKNRAEVGIFGRSTGNEVLKKLGFSDIKALEPPIVVSDLFLYIHKKHEKLIPEIVSTLQQMKKEGTYYRIAREYGYLERITEE